MLLAAWLAGASALMGCAYAMSAARAEQQTQTSQHAMAAAPREGTDAHHCCSKPVGDVPTEPAKQGQFQECCFRVLPATVGKGKPAQAQVAVSERQAAGIEPGILPEFHAGIEPAMEDSSGDYLLFRVLRI